MMNKQITLLTCSFLLVFGALCYSCSSNDLSKEEQKLVGAWDLEISPSNNGSKNFTYIRLDLNRQGLKGILHQKGSKFIFAPSLSYEINNWHIKNDTLIMTYTFESGIISVPGQKDQEYEAFQEKDYLIIKEMGEDYFIADSYHPSIPWNSEQRYEKRRRAGSINQARGDE
jgi:hypothetical protein